MINETMMRGWLKELNALQERVILHEGYNMSIVARKSGMSAFFGLTSDLMYLASTYIDVRDEDCYAAEKMNIFANRVNSVLDGND